MQMSCPGFLVLGGAAVLDACRAQCTRGAAFLRHLLLLNVPLLDPQPSAPAVLLSQGRFSLLCLDKRSFNNRTLLAILTHPEEWQEEAEHSAVCSGDALCGNSLREITAPVMHPEL